MNVGFFEYLIYSAVFFLTAFSVAFVIASAVRELSTAVRRRGGGYIALLSGFILPCVASGYLLERQMISAVIGLLLLYPSAFIKNRAVSNVIVFLSSASAVFFAERGQSRGLFEAIIAVIVIYTVTRAFSKLRELTTGVGAMLLLIMTGISAINYDLILLTLSITFLGGMIGVALYSGKRKRLPLGGYGEQLTGFMISFISVENNSGNFGKFAIPISLAAVIVGNVLLSLEKIKRTANNGTDKVAKNVIE